MRRHKGRRNLADSENLPVTTHVHELSAEERACPCCGVQRQEIGADESWQVEYYPGHFERIQHLRKKYACPGCESNGAGPSIQTAAKPEAAIEKGMAGPGLLAYIVTSKFSDYLPLYRLEDIFERQGFEISRATQSIWCGDVADLVEPLYELMAARVRASHVVATDDTIMPMLAKGKTANARMWVYVGDEAGPYNIFDFTLNRGRDGPEVLSQRLPECAAGRRLWRLQRRGGRQRDHARGVLGARAQKDRRRREDGSRDRAGGGRVGARAVCRGTPRQRPVRGCAAGTAPGRDGAGVGWPEGEASRLETAVAAEASRWRRR